eukprot:13801049-Alexandrium_andersonii.AAC.1
MPREIASDRDWTRLSGRPCRKQVGGCAEPGPASPGALAAAMGPTSRDDPAEGNCTTKGVRALC